MASCKCAFFADLLLRMQLRSASPKQRGGTVPRNGLGLGVEDLSRPSGSRPSLIGGRGYRADRHVTGFKPINCELWNWNSFFSFIFFCLLNIEVWMLFKLLLLMLMAHLGCVFSHMYWFLIKAWWYCNRLFVQFNKMVFESCLKSDYELDIKGIKWLARRLTGL